MRLRRWQVQLSLPEPTFALGAYFWTNTHYYDLDNPPSTETSAQKLRDSHRLLLTTNGVIDGISVYPNATTRVPSTCFINGDDPGFVPLESGYSPFDTAYVRWVTAGRQVGYTRLRVPIPAADQVGGLLSEDMWSYINATCSFYWLTAKCCDRNGVPIEEFIVDRAVHMWQYRHGSERSQRRVFTC